MTLHLTSIIEPANHAVSNAEAWHCEIVAWDNRWSALDDSEGREENRPEPLSVEVRCPWVSVASDLALDRGQIGRDGEYCILLSTGGPALRIIGELDGYSEPTSARLQWQDWGTAWTDHHCDTEPLLAYAQSFWFGE